MNLSMRKKWLKAKSSSTPRATPLHHPSLWGDPQVPHVEWHCCEAPTWLRTWASLGCHGPLLTKRRNRGVASIQSYCHPGESRSSQCEESGESECSPRTGIPPWARPGTKQRFEKTSQRGQIRELKSRLSHFMFGDFNMFTRSTIDLILVNLKVDS